MKKGLIYLLIFSYSTIMLKPVFPFIADIAAHAFWYSHHMATVHYEHGKYHVHYEIQEAAKNNTPEKNNNATLNEPVSGEHISPFVSYAFYVPFTIQQQFTTLSSALVTNSLNSDYPPPKI
jgi:hypothetical protein